MKSSNIEMLNDVSGEKDGRERPNFVLHYEFGEKIEKKIVRKKKKYSSDRIFL